MKFKVSGRSIYLNESGTRFEQGYGGVSVTESTEWEAYLQSASLTPYGYLTITRTGPTAEEAKTALIAAVEAQGFEWTFL